LSATDARWLPKRAAWWLVTVLFITACISYADRLVLSALVDPIRQSLGLTDSSVGVLQGPAFTLVYVFAALIFGRLADRKNRRTLIIAGSVGWCLSTAFCGMANGFWMFLVARMLVGVSEAALVPTAVSMIADGFEPKRRGTAVGFFAMGTAIGGPLGVTIGGLLLSSAQSGVFAQLPALSGLEPWRTVLLMMGLLGLASPALVATLREPRRQQTVEGATLRVAVEHFKSDRVVLIPLYGAAAMLAIGDYGLVSWVPTTLSRSFGWASAQAGVAFGLVTGLTSVAGALCGGYLSDFGAARAGTGARLRVALSLAFLAAIGAAAVAAPTAILVLVGLGLWILASTAAGVGAIATLQELIPGQFRGTSVAILTFCNTLIGLGCGPTLVALVTDHVYARPEAVGIAISTVVVPAGIISVAGFMMSKRALAGRNRTGEKK
jgi:predicted MFS family arabinose efflux permease